MPSGSRSTSSPMALFIADDHSIVRDGLRVLLERTGRFLVLGDAPDGRTLVQRALELQPEAILTDLAMTELNGIEATRAIRGFAPEIKIIGVSVQAERSYVNEMLRNGANGYVTKNSPSTEMVTAIDEVLAGKTYLCEEVGHLRPAIVAS